MGQADFYKRGDYNAVCFECGGKFKASDLKLHWRGYMVCEKDWEPRHPQDLVGSPPPEKFPSWTQPQPDPVFVSGSIFPTPPVSSDPPVEYEPDAPPVVPPSLPPDVPAEGDGNTYLTDENGVYLLDENGNYLILE